MFNPATLATAAAAALLATAATATPMTISQGAGGTFGPANLSENVTVNYQGANQNLGAGFFDLVSDVFGDFLAFCIDLDTNLNLPASYEMSVPSQISASEQTNIDKLFTSAYADIDTSEEAAGFQIALWEVITDSALDLSVGDFQFTTSGAVLTNANAYLAGLATAGTGGYKLMYLDAVGGANGSQDLITAAPVPLPAAAWMLGAGLAGLGYMGRKKRA